MDRILRQCRIIWQRALVVTGCAVPAAVRDNLARLQHARIGALIPVLHFTIAMIAIVAGSATGGGFDPVYHVILPGTFVALGLYRCLVWRRRKKQTLDIAIIRRQLWSTTFIALAFGLIGGLWTLDAYYNTPDPRRVLAPGFIFMLTFAAAICLNSLPRAAIGAMVTALAGPTAAMILSGDMGIRAMGISLMIVCWLMIGLTLNNFSQMVGGLKMRMNLKRLSETDVLTGLANRRAFASDFDILAKDIDRNKPIALMMIDLDGFKAANDKHGHAVGDDILVQVSDRLRTLCKSAACIARLGGDEFAILFATAGNLDHYIEHQGAIRKVLSLPYVCDDQQVFIGASIGMASSPESGLTISSLLKAADKELYADKHNAKSRQIG